MVKLTRGRLMLLSLAGAVVVLLPAYLRAYNLSGSSDAPTLLKGDKVIVNQAAYWIKLPYTRIKLAHISRPKRGDLVLIQRPDQSGVVFKRVLGLPEETLEIRDNRVIIDGRPLPLKVVSTDTSWVPASHRMGNTIYDEDGHRVAFTPGAGKDRNFAAIHLKPGEYFVMGDNRDPSLDCRAWGPLKEDAILGKVIITVPTGPRNK